MLSFFFLAFQFCLKLTLERNLKCFTPRQVETEHFLNCEMNMSSIGTKETKGQAKPRPLAYFYGRHPSR